MHGQGAGTAEKPCPQRIRQGIGTIAARAQSLIEPATALYEVTVHDPEGP
jgi:hypothetical protein